MKSMRVPVLIIEHPEDADTIMHGLQLLLDSGEYNDPPFKREQLRSLIDEVAKVQGIIRKTNRS